MVSAGVFTHGGIPRHVHRNQGGLLALTRSMAASWPTGIRVNALAPGPVDTDMVRNNTAEIRQRMANAPVMGRLDRAEEMVARPSFWPATPRAS